MRVLILTASLICLFFCACSKNPVADDSEFSFDDATGQPMKVTVTQNEAIVNPSTSIFISIPESGDITFIVYGSTGEKIRTLADGSTDGGDLVIEWDGRNDSGESIKSGIYVFMIRFIGATKEIKQYEPAYIQVPTE